jgi:NADPH2:quinone reductase
MRAAVFEEPGAPDDVLSVQDVPAPEPGPDDVLVQVERSVIQPADSMFIRAHYRIRPNLPQAAGLEGTGAVVAAGVRATIVAGRA